jgi:hypothetical protein
VTSEKSVDNAQRIDALVARIATLEANTLNTAYDSWHETAALANGWAKGSGYLKYKLLNPYVIWLEAMSISPGTVADGTPILTSALGTAYRPQTWKRFPVFVDNVKAGSATYEMAACALMADGTINTYGVNVNATTCDFSAIMPLGH